MEDNFWLAQLRGLITEIREDFVEEWHLSWLSSKTDWVSLHMAGGGERC